MLLHPNDENISELFCARFVFHLHCKLGSVFLCLKVMTNINIKHRERERRWETVKSTGLSNECSWQYLGNSVTDSKHLRHIRDEITP